MIDKAEWLNRYAARVLELTHAPAEFAPTLMTATVFEERRVGYEDDPESAAEAEVRLWQRADEVSNGAALSPEEERAARRVFGRVAVDERGNSTFEWLSETGRFRRDIETQKIKALELPFSIEDNEPAHKAVSGMNPYDTTERPSKQRSAPDKRPVDDFITDVERQIRSRATRK
jgi:hypothetical protein